MQATFSFGQSADLRAIRDRLRVQFGWIRDEPRLDPVSQFIRAFLGGRNETSWGALGRLQRRFGDADAIADAGVEDIADALGEALRDKAVDLKRALGKIRIRAGALELEFLRTLDVDAALVWLEQIHGVGRTIGAAVLAFSTLRRRAMVVDAPVTRIMERFGFVRRGARTEEVYAALMNAATGLDAGELYELHRQLKRLGQSLCTQQRASCEHCPLADLCMQRLDEPPPVRRAA